MTYLFISLGSAFGGVLRYILSNLLTTGLGAGFPYGTLLVNVTGSFLIGWFATMQSPHISPMMRDMLMIGICGGYTTFSSFSLQTLTLLRNGECMKAAVNVVGSVVLCMVAVWLGTFIGNGK